ncbi:MAG: tRNA (adenosine(37)-N6)-threonylcarbamoyltransferase complex ATPase subunit type 1 TsaE [Bacteroidetes bacterium]|nr:tRNA (adenosine(37)-N6)-threonylcarbamoyltransferase complex ATPase subunit type 1 TsaE [Bacteroidota bacterium]
MILTSTLESLPEISKQILGAFPYSRVFALYGRMGAGKTTLIKELCHQLTVTDEVQSPTFSIINEYKTSGKESVYHFDFYRINKIEEVFDIGYEDYVYSGSYCFIEWPELAEDLLPEGTVRLEISGENKRVIRF